MDQKKGWKGIFQQHREGIDDRRQRKITKGMMRMSHVDFQRTLSYIEQDITWKQVLGGNKVISPKERLALTVCHTQNCLALLPSLHPWWPWLRLLNCACAGSTMLKERGKWFQLCFNIPNIPENKRNVERMLNQSLKALANGFNICFNILAILLNGNAESVCHPLSTLLKRVERMLNRCWKSLKAFKLCFNIHSTFLIS